MRERDGEKKKKKNKETTRHQDMEETKETKNIIGNEMIFEREIDSERTRK
jgi:hypothetical protein